MKEKKETKANEDRWTTPLKLAPIAHFCKKVTKASTNRNKHDELR